MRGKAKDNIGQMDDESKQDYMSNNNDYMSHDEFFSEGSYYWTEKHEKNEKDEISDEYFDLVDNEFIFNDVNENRSQPEPNKINSINILMNYLASHDTIVIAGNIESKIVTSSCEKADNFCSQRVVFYTDGYVKTNFVDEKYFGKLYYENETLIYKSNK